MKEKLIFIGIDVSKTTLDICMLSNTTTESWKIKNQAKCIRTFFNKLIKRFKEARCMVCMESTGYYNWPSYEALDDLELTLFVVNPLHLKRSLGLVRGKNDVIDAKRIAAFLGLHHSSLKPFIIPRKQIRIIQALLAHRNRLIEMKTKISVPSGELHFVADKEISGYVQKASLKIIKELETQIKAIENKLNTLIEDDNELNETYGYLTSVQGVGKVLAWTALVKTNEFKTLNNPRKLACYAGVVPFDYQSGTSINKSPRVSPMADKTMKKLLHMAAMRAVRIKGELQDYYQRKVKEGKNKMLVLNAVRNKIVTRMCASVNNKRVYQNYLLLS
jgi:transposase